MKDGLHIIEQKKPTSPPFYAVFAMNGHHRTGYGPTPISAAVEAVANFLMTFEPTDAAPADPGACGAD